MAKCNALILLAVSWTIVFCACKKDNDMVEDCQDFHWGYQGDMGPDHWGACYTDCGGKSQSPVDIAGVVAGEGLSALETHYEEAPIELLNNGHTIEFEYEYGSVLRLDGVDYDLL